MAYEHQLSQRFEFTENRLQLGHAEAGRKLTCHHELAVVLKGFGQDFRSLHGTNQGAGKDQVRFKPLFQHRPGGFPEECPSFGNQVPHLIGEIGGSFGGCGMPHKTEFHDESPEKLRFNLR
jgi:hypothetical protein